MEMGTGDEPVVVVGEPQEVLSNPRRRAPKVAVGVGAAVVLVALGAAVLGSSSSRGRSASALVRAGPAATTGAGTAELSGDVTLSIGGDDQTISRFRGKIDFRSSASALTMSAGATRTEFRSLGGVSYESTSLVSLPGGAHWVRFTRADVGMQAGSSSGLGSTDPTSGLEFMNALSGKPRVVDRGQPDGESVTHYAFTLDLETFVNKMGQASKKLGASQLARGLQALAARTDLARVPGEAWLDASGRVTRFDYTLAIRGPDGELVSDTSHLRFSHFGEPVTIEAPDPSDVVPFSQVPDFLTRLEHAVRSSPAA